VQNNEPSQPENLPSPPVKKDFIPLESLPISPDNPPWNGWTAFGVWFASIAFIIIFPMLFLLPYMATQNISFFDQTGMADFMRNNSTAILLQVAAIIPAHIFTFLLAWLVVTKFKKYSFRETLGWEWNGFKVWHSFAIFAVFYGIALSLTAVLGETETEFDRMLKSSRTVVYLVAFFATFTAPLVEEVIYRGLLYSAFQRTFGVVAAVILVTVLFTAIHIPQYSSESIPNYASLITLLLLSLTLTLIRVRTGNLLPCVFLHTIINGVQSVLLILSPYIEKYAETPSQTGSLIHFFK
jgi:membrane protease YdiL (CAAX protease family)